MDKKIQAKSISDESFLAVVDRREPASLWQVADDTGMPVKVVRAKARSLIRRGVIAGCACGCRGDFRRPERLAVARTP